MTRRAACVVLTGTGANGSMGLKCVNEYGGVTAAQDPEEAEYPEMPRNAIATGLEDYVLKDPPFSHMDLITCRNLLI